MASKSKVYFFFDNVSITLKNLTKLKRTVELVFKHEKKPLGCLNYVFCSDKKLLEINRRYLKHNYYTDIITFDLSESSKPINGEIYISLDRVKDNAQKMGELVSTELSRVVFHGALHLCGYEDKSKPEKEKMRAREQYFIDRLLK